MSDELFPDWIERGAVIRDGKAMHCFFAKESCESDADCVFVPGDMSSAGIAFHKDSIIGVLAERVIAHRHPTAGASAYFDVSMRFFESDQRGVMPSEADQAIFAEYSALTGKPNPLEGAAS